MRRSAFVLLGSLFIVLMMAQPVHATSTSVSYSDRPGDLARWRYIVSIDPYDYILGPPVPEYGNARNIGYCDILEAGLSTVDDEFVFEMTVAGDLPSKGIIPGVHYVIWSFAPQFGTDSFWNGGDVVLQWDGQNYEAFFWDTRPVMESGNVGDILQTAIDYETYGATLTLTVPTTLFGVDHFLWFFRVVVLGGEYNEYTGKGGPYVVVDMTDPEYAVNPVPYPGFYLPWLSWPQT